MNNVILLDEIKGFTNSGELPLDEVMGQEFANVKSTLNSILEGLPATPGAQEWTSPGTYQFIVPPKVTVIKLSMTGAGGGGGGLTWWYSDYCGYQATNGGNGASGGASSFGSVVAQGGIGGKTGQLALSNAAINGGVNSFDGGGNGGSGNGDGSWRAYGGAAGAVVTRTISVRAGDVITVVVGRGGASSIITDTCPGTGTPINVSYSGQNGSVKISW